jgi:hypothetical protein
MTDFLIRCRVCDEAAGTHQWLTLPSASTRGRWAVDHTADTGHDNWFLYDGPIGGYTHELEHRLAAAVRLNRELYGLPRRSG